MSFVSPKPTTSGLPDTPVTPPCPRILFDDTLHASPRDCLREKVVLSLNKNSSVATTDHISGGRIFLKLSDDIIVQVMSSLRAYDLGALQQTCKAFADPALANRVVKYVSAGVYPESLTAGFTTAQVSGIVSTGERLLNFKNMRDMEMLVVARVLSRPEPAEGFWVSKAWCKSALKWLEATTKTPKKNLSKRKGRIRDRRLSDALPPWPNINVDIMCEHGSLVTSSKPGAKRKVIDKKAWRVLRKLYPDSSSIPTSNGECVHCQFERLEGKRRKEKALEEGRAERKKVLAVGLVRDVYRRSKGVPEGAIRSSAAASPSTSSTRSFTSTTGVPLCSPCSSTPTSVVDLETQFSNFRINKVAGGKPTPFSPPKKLKSPVQITSWPTLEQAAKKSHVFPFSTPTQQVIGASIKKPVTAPVPLCLTPPTNLPPPPVLKMASVAPPAPVAPAPLVDGSYKILPRKFLHSWRHYIKAGGAKACLSDSPSMLCEAHGHVVVPKHLKDYLMGNTENLFGERGAEAQLDRENDCVVEVLTEREYEAFCDKFPETRRMVGYAVGFEIRGGRVEW
eukprot:CAMPEP_0118657108 /NCGR_PEP_ID=MMETSP0785-20121206/13835_1 /TAXON_ID=91992 /ORGANISM="Bolidomonas pacifica, Strain CCMP 1866" /LENGTH=563 /DNA_ID=CAMNT_0006549989 /DNA_START=358 /DNA_END=2046 /DNA_ORIENTATION=-